MKIKLPSKGVVIFGLYFIAGGILNLIKNFPLHFLFYRNKELWVSVAERQMVWFRPIIARAETNQQIASQLYEYFEMLISKPPYVLISAILLPTIYLLFALAGIGLLRKKEYWRKTILFLYPLGAALSFIKTTYEVGLVTTIVNINKTLNARVAETLPAQFLSMFDTNQALLVSVFLGWLLLVTAVLFFFTRPRVKAQF